MAYDYNPFWEEYPKMPKVDKAYNQGYDDGYSSGYKKAVEYNEEIHKLEERIDCLEALIGANVRVIKEELKKELSEEHSDISK